MIIRRKSMFTGKVHELDIPVTQEQLDAWWSGKLIQDVMPHLTPDQREFLISGTTPEEWGKMFPPEE